MNGYKAYDKVMVDKLTHECFQPITTSKNNYLKSLGNKLIDKATGPKAYWNIINSLRNKCKIPRMTLFQLQIEQLLFGPMQAANLK